MPVWLMLKMMPSSEMTEWIAYYRIKFGMHEKPAEKIKPVQTVYEFLSAKFAKRIIKKKK